MDLDILKNGVTNGPMMTGPTPDWLELSVLLGKTSEKITENNPIHEELSDLIHFMLSVAKCYDINLQHAWSRWKKKAINKIYK